MKTRIYFIQFAFLLDNALSCAGRKGLSNEDVNIKQNPVSGSRKSVALLISVPPLHTNLYSSIDM